MTSIINLGTEVYVTDPCYTVPTWCQAKLENVLPGDYIATVLFDERGGTGRNAELYVVHKDYQNVTKYGPDGLKWDWYGDIGVDSGQAGIFDAASYRDDAAVVRMVLPHSEFVLPGDKQPGDEWYTAMCKYTLNTEENWGAYERGVVSCSGYGDGIYPLFAAENEEGKIVAMQVIFIDQDEEEDEEEDDWDDDLNFVEEQEEDLK